MPNTTYYTIAGAAKYKGVTYPTVAKAIKDAKLTPVIANDGLKGQEVKLLTKEQLDQWEPTKRTRLTEEERVRRAAKLLGITPEAMKAALRK